MSKVDWITWKTDPKEIINPEEVDKEILEYYQNYNSVMNPMIYEQLKNEISKGGLNKDAFNVSGISPANEMAVDIINTIDDIATTMDNLRESILDITSTQKEIEKKQLIAAIKDKIKKEEVFLKNIEERAEIKNNIRAMGENPDDIIYIIKDRLKKLNERLDMAESL